MSRLISTNFQVLRKLLCITIITDRWPSEVANSIDGPKIFDNKKEFNYLLFIFLNKLFYKMNPNVDLVIVLETIYMF